MRSAHPLSDGKGRARRRASTLFTVVFSCLALASLGQPAALLAQDFGDAPDSYRTRINSDGAQHAFNPDIFLGQFIDTEQDGLPTATADGDDTTPAGAPDDEDGVAFPSGVAVGSSVPVTVVASADGFLSAWLDIAGDGSFAEASDRIFADQPLAKGTNNLTFTMTSNAEVGLTTFARFRFSRQSQLNYFGPAEDGEVEDYVVQLQEPPSREEDFGDAPDSYRTRLNSDGARHGINPDVFLGLLIDAERDGQPTADATGDDLNPAGAGDDEDGVVLPSSLSPGATVTVTVRASVDGLLSAWLDMAGDGSFGEAGDQIFADVPLAGGTNTLSFVVSPDAKTGIFTFARFRFSGQSKLAYFGPADDGEVEDYEVRIEQPQADNLDFGDAPDSYRTTLEQDGARHFREPGVMLGKLLDVEGDGQPTSTALGDDNNPSPDQDDEDGVRFLTPLAPGQPATVEVNASISGILYAWIDFDGDGTFAQPNNLVFGAVGVSSGDNMLNFVVPPEAELGQTYARFRFSFDSNLNWFGPSDIGEVEDYQVEIETPQVPCEGNAKGTDFWVTFPANYAPDPDNPLKLSLCIVGVRDTTGRVEIPGIGWSMNFVIPGSMMVTIELPPEADLGDGIDVVQDNGVHVQASAPVAVYGLSRVRYTTDGFTAIPAIFLGKEYIVQSFANVHSGVPSLNGTQFGLVACEDGTTVSITPSTDVAGHPAGVPFSIQLDAGQTYQLRDTNDAPADLSGTLVAADKRVGVFGSHRCANIPDENTWFCDYIVEQQLPVERAGQFFVTMPLATRTGGDLFRIWAVQDGTQILINGAPVALLNRGEFHETILTVPSEIVAEGRALVMQYATSSDFDLVTDSDPFQLVVPSISQFDSQYMVCVPDSGYASSYLNLVVPDAAVGSILLNGVAVPAGSYVPIPGTGFHGAQVSVTPGAYNVVSPGPGPRFGLSVYGWAEYDSFGYPGGYFFRDRTPPEVTCLESNVTVAASQECVAPVPDLRELVVWRDNCPPSPNSVVVQTPRPDTLVGVGVHVVTLSVTDSQGNTGSCEITLEVLDSGPPQLNCPELVMADCETAEGAIVTYEVQATGQCGGEVPVEVLCDPPSGSLFPPGDTLVTCTAMSPQGQVATCSFQVTVRCLGIALAPQPGGVVVTWTGGGTLQTATDPTGPWSDMSGVTSPLNVATEEPTTFFRVRYP